MHSRHADDKEAGNMIGQTRPYISDVSAVGPKVKIDNNTRYSHREGKVSLGKRGHGSIDGLAAETWVKPVTSWLYSGQSMKRVKKYILRRTCGDHRCSPWNLNQRVQDMFFTVFQSLSHREYNYFYLSYLFSYSCLVQRHAIWHVMCMNYGWRCSPLWRYCHVPPLWLLVGCNQLFLQFTQTILIIYNQCYESPVILLVIDAMGYVVDMDLAAASSRVS